MIIFPKTNNNHLHGDYEGVQHSHQEDAEHKYRMCTHEVQVDKNY